MYKQLVAVAFLFLLGLGGLSGCGEGGGLPIPDRLAPSAPMVFYATSRVDLGIVPADRTRKIVVDVVPQGKDYQPGELATQIISPSVYNGEDTCTCAEMEATWTLGEPAVEEEKVTLVGRFESGGTFIGDVDPQFAVELYHKAGEPPDPCIDGIHPPGNEEYEELTTATVEVGADSVVFPPVFLCGNFYGAPPQGYAERLFLAVAGSNPQPRTRIVFASDTGYRGNLGGLAGADGLCNDMAAAGGLPSGDYRAWMSDATDSPSTRFTHDGGPFQLPDGGIIAQDWADLVDGELNDAIAVDFWGEFIDVAAFVWTNTDWRGEIVSTSSEENCSSWTNPDPEQMGGVGRMHWGGENWTYAGTAVSCADEEPFIYCFQQ